MQVFNIFTLLFGFALAAAEAKTCFEKTYTIPDTITTFCGNGFTVPSTYASTGRSFPYKGKLTVTGNCSPAQFVSKADCIRQFTEVCNGGGPLGGGQRYFGKNGCQLFKIKPTEGDPIPGGLQNWRRKRVMPREVEEAEAQAET